MVSSPGNLTIRLFGGLSASSSGRAVHFQSGKVGALLAYLVMEAAMPVSRERLAGLLWPDRSDGVAGANLRSTIVRLRNAIADTDRERPVLLVTREAVHLAPDADVTVDVWEFQRALAASSRHSHRFAATCRTCAEHRQRAIDRYVGDFLSGTSVPDSDLFENWALLWRKELAFQASDAYEALLTYCWRRGERDRHAELINRLLRLDPWNEVAHAHLLRLYVLDGRRAAAMRYYRELTERFQRELGVGPSQELGAMVEAISGGATPSHDIDERSMVPGLPRPLDNFVGRSSDVRRLREWLESPGARLATIVGPGGSGKTRLAIAAAEMEAQAFPNGARFLELAEREPAWSADVGRLVRAKEVLLIVDGVDGKSGAARSIQRLLDENPGVVVLATSRTPIGLLGETLIPLAGLSTPPHGIAADVERYDAVTLFIQSAKRASPEFTPDDDDLAAISEICRLVGGLPLAVNLAAAWVATIDCPRIANEIKQSPYFLSSGDAAAVSENGIGSVFDQSLAMLTEHERMVFPRLSVFRGGFDSEAAAAVANADLEVLSGLTRKSFVHHLSGGRYDLHPLFRQFAAELLEKASESSALEAAHFDYYLAGAERRSSILLRSETVAPFHWLIVERLNLSTAYDWAQSNDKRKAKRLALVMHSDTHGQGFHHTKLP